MQIGQKGVKYGLSVPKQQSRPVPKKGLAVFGDDDSGDEQEKIAKQIEQQALKKQSDAKVAKMQAAALAEDPSIFDYDSHYDKEQELKLKAKPAGQPERKSRYIESLLEKTKERQREQDIIYERKLLRERKAEDHLFGDKERFVTAAYKKKLEEDKKWQEEDAMREKLEAQNDVRKKGNMGDFYRNLLTNNVAFGTAQEEKSEKPRTDAIQQAEPPSSRLSSSNGSDAARQSEARDENWEQMRRAREAHEERQAAAKTQPHEKDSGRGQDTGANLGDAPKSSGTGVHREEQVSQGDGKEGAGEQAVEKKEDKAAAARERFLARKRKLSSIT